MRKVTFIFSGKLLGSVHVEDEKKEREKHTAPKKQFFQKIQFSKSSKKSSFDQFSRAS